MYLYVLKETIEKVINRRLSYEEIQPFLGQSIAKILLRLIPDRDKALEAKKYADELCLSGGALSKVSLLPYAKEVVEALKKRGHSLAILTNSARAFVEEALRRLFTYNYWDLIVTADDGFDTKVEGALYLIERFRALPERTVYIADMAEDIRVARRVGCKVIAIPGWHDRETLKREGPDRLITSLLELIR